MGFKDESPETQQVYMDAALMVGTQAKTKVPIYQGSKIHELILEREHETEMLQLLKDRPEVYKIHYPYPLTPEHHDYEVYYSQWVQASLNCHAWTISMLDEEIKKRMYFFGKGKQVDDTTITVAKVSAGLEGIADVLEEAGLQVFVDKRVWKFRCNHGTDTTPSGTITMYNGVPGWKCFGCNKGGDILDALKVYHNYNFIESLRWLSKYIGIILIK